ncbi:MMPL family transporter [Nocardioides marmorisolisilvae]|uniref:MMPL family transporter n=1 Tax=Nocardioides marmorisolisilvae TaxID=1542737 RepID=A0A3N0DI51_9ACTN|nr:MMPL family transporter [Nocardioides marmorisolisilvae]RNL75325.1 MMPL family transporter [Nocardioides marmorisolisilvae]
MERWARFVLRHRLWVVLFWVVILVAGGGVAQKTTDRLTIDFSLPHEPGTKAADLIVENFHNGGNTSPALVTITVKKGTTVEDSAADIHAAFDQVTKDVPNTRMVDQVNAGGDKAFVSKDHRTAYAYVFYPFPKSQTDLAPTKKLQKSLDAHKPAGATAGVTGLDALAVGSDDQGNSVLVETIIGAVGALAVLAFVFASFLAVLPLIIALFSIMATFLLLLPLTYATDVSFIVQFLVALIGLGVAIDYSLILVTRWREERDHGKENHEAVVAAMSTAGSAVLFSGLTVAIGLLALIVLPVPFMRSIGMGGALIPFASVAVTLSLMPAILSSIGPWLDRPKIRHENTASKGWSSWARGVVKHRWLAAGSAFLVLGLLFAAFTGIKIGAPASDSLAKNGAAYDTLHVLEDGGVSTGVLTPIEVIAKTSDAPAAAAKFAAVKGIQTALVSNGPTSNANGKTVILVIPKDETVNNKTVQPVKDVKKLADTLPGVYGVAGLGTAQVDFLHGVYGNFPLMLGLIALLTFILLVRAFRSVLLPLKAVILNLISLTGVYGAMVLFWQDGHGSNALFGIQETGAITFWVPLMVFAFLFGLSMDYEVFILARIREEYDAGHSTNEAVIEGIGRTGRLVTSAALILFLAFAALASGPGTDLKILATALGIGILLDATIVRSLLVPSLVSLFGRWNWYLPDWLAKLLFIQPSVLHEERPTQESAQPTA